MLPTSTSSRNPRESKIGKQSARSIEIQRLIGRSLRTIVDLKKIPGKQFILDCDVLQADGGTRTASITGAFVALSLSINKLLAIKKISKNPIKDFIAGVSCGIVNGEILVDLDYLEDSNAEVDANFVFTKNSGISEIQISGEKNPDDPSAAGCGGGGGGGGRWDGGGRCGEGAGGGCAGAGVGERDVGLVERSVARCGGELRGSAE